MKTSFLFFLAATSLTTLTSCQYLPEIDAEQVQEYVAPENVALAAASILLHEYPAAEEFLAQIEVELHDIALGNQLTTDEIYDRLDNLLPGNKTKYKKETMLVVRTLLNHYEHVLNQKNVDLTKYADVLLGFANGIDQALYIYAGNSEPK